MLPSTIKRQLFLKIPFLLLIPLMVYLTGESLQMKMGYFFFKHNLEPPAYLYLINSLNISQGQPVNQIDNPGITLEVLGATVIKAIQLKEGINNTEEDVIKRPEYYLEVINRVLIIFVSLSLLLLGVVSLILSNNLWLSLLLQGALFISPKNFYSLTRVGPEPVLIIVSIFWVIAILIILFRQDFLERYPKTIVFLSSFLTAIGLVTKITFVPFAIIPFLIINGFKRKLYFMFLTIVLFHIFFIPGLIHYDRFILWIFDIITHTGTYGRGEIGFVDFPVFFQGMEVMINQLLPFCLVLITSIGLLFLLSTVRKARNIGNSLEVRLFWGITLAIILQSIFALKHSHYELTHYVIPSLMFVSLLIYLILRITNKVTQLLFSGSVLSAIKIFIILTLIVFVWKSGSIQFLAYELSMGYHDMIPPISLPCQAAFFSIIAVLFIFPVTPLFNRDFSTSLNWVIACLVLVLHFNYFGTFRHELDHSGEFEELNQVLGKYDPNIFAKIIAGPVSSNLYALKDGANGKGWPPQNYFSSMEKIYSHENAYFFYRHKFQTWTKEISFKEIVETNNGNVIIHAGDCWMPQPELFEKVAEVKNESIYVLKKLEYTRYADSTAKCILRDICEGR